MFSGSSAQLVAPLADNGGATQTHDLVFPFNPAIDTGNEAACASLDFDQRGAPFPRAEDGNGDLAAICDIGAVEFVDLLAPEAMLSDAPDITLVGTTMYEFVVSLTDDSSIDSSSIDVNDMTITGPNGASLPTDVSLATLDNANFAVTYQLAPRDGTWDAGDSGSYTISVNSGQVTDIFSKPVMAAVLGSFEVTFVPLSGEILFSDGFESQ